MPYYHRDPKSYHNFDNHPCVYIYICISRGRFQSGGIQGLGLVVSSCIAVWGLGFSFRLGILDLVEVRSLRLWICWLGKGRIPTP